MTLPPPGQRGKEGKDRTAARAAPPFGRTPRVATSSLSLPDDTTRCLEVRSVENRPVVIALAFLLLFAALAFWRSCSY